MKPELRFPRDARHCACLGHRAGHPERHIAEPLEPAEVVSLGDRDFSDLLHAATIDSRAFGRTI